jgi:hypothetical protein
VVPGAFVALVLLAGQVGARQAFWFGLTDDMLDLDGGRLLRQGQLHGDAHS